MKVLLGVGGGIAAFKAAALASQLVQAGCELRVAMTRDAHRFIGATTFAGLSGSQVIASSTQIDADGSAPHIQATKNADCLVIMPATASLIARLAAGVCDDPVTLCSVAFRGRRIACPAMNDAMWEDPSVQRNVDRLRADGFEILGPVEGHLAEGYAAMGRMIEPEAVIAAVLERR